MAARQRSGLVRIGGLAALVLWASASARGQGLPSEPIVFGHGRVVVSGDASLTASCSHAAGAAGCTADTGFFNYSDYEHSTLRMVQLGLSTSIRISNRLSALGEFRVENGTPPRPYGLYLRFRPFDRHDFDIQAGRIPSTFGAFARHAYGADNPVIGYPLAYQYLLSLRADAVPAGPDDLIRMRGRGWLSNFPLGNLAPEAGLPIADAFKWDTGVQAHGSVRWLEAAASITTGSLANPLFRDDNEGRQLAARLAARPLAGLVVGASASRAPYVTSGTATLVRARAQDFMQRALGADIEYSRDHYVVRFEAVASAFELATIEPTLRATAALVEGRYKLTPRLFVAGRLDHLGFNTIAGTTRAVTWEAPVTRWEVGGGYAVQRNLQLRASFQHNTRDGGRVRRMTAAAGQLLYWF
ncbi:MAG TPA: hypothetical protein VM032_09980 [Vicinamibacterales bacterium]|nr:hypothetical protein [Vicinamibacterales bacterium]